MHNKKILRFFGENVVILQLWKNVDCLAVNSLWTLKGYVNLIRNATGWEQGLNFYIECCTYSRD